MEKGWGCAEPHRAMLLPGVLYPRQLIRKALTDIGKIRPAYSYTLRKDICVVVKRFQADPTIPDNLKKALGITVPASKTPPITPTALVGQTTRGKFDHTGVTPGQPLAYKVVAARAPQLSNPSLPVTVYAP